VEIKFIRQRILVKSSKGGRMAKENGNILGAWAFLIGVIIAVLAGFVPAIDLTMGIWAAVFAALGIIIGLLNVTAKETKDFLMAGAILVIVSALSKSSGIEIALPYVSTILNALVILFAPATIVVALKSVFVAARR
jgi:hypothetical protein